MKKLFDSDWLKAVQKVSHQSKLHIVILDFA